MGLKPALKSIKIIHVCLVTVFILAHLPFAHGADEDSLPWKITADQITHQHYEHQNCQR